MTEHVRGVLAGLAAMLAGGCLVSGTLGTYPTDESGTMETAPASTSEPTGGEVCPEGEPGPCASCLGDLCCEALSACGRGLACACMFDCLTQGATAKQCVTSCGAGQAAMQFSMCTRKNCAPVCAQD